MSIHHLERIFHPQSVAVIGASERPQSVGAVLMRNLVEAGYNGEIHPVNHRYRTLWGRACHRSLTDIGKPVDLAVIATRITTVPRIIHQCARQGVGGAVIISAGGKETGGHGAEMEAQIREAAAGSSLRIIGPSSLGVACARSKLNVTAAHRLPPEGRLAFISQSGALATSIFDSAGREGIGFSYFISLGSMMDVEFGDAVDYLGNDSRVSSIVMYMEQLNNGRRFMSAARSVSRIKPIIALKAGRTAPGERAAANHTGAETGEDAVYDAAFKRAGILRVSTFEELFDCAELVAKQPYPQKAGLVIVSNAGGPAVMAADVLGDHGVEPAALSAETMARLEEILSPLWSRANPVDIRGDATPQRYLQVVDCLLKAPEAGGLLVMLAPHALSDPTNTAHLLVARLQSTGNVPVVTAWLGGASTEHGREIFNLAGIPTFDSPERAVRAFMDLYHYGRNLEMLQQIPVKRPGRLSFDRPGAEAIIQLQLSTNQPDLGEVQAKQLLQAYGIPVNPAFTAADANHAVRIAEQLKYPVVLKVDTPEHAHKSHWGGVRLNLTNEAAVRQAFMQLTADAYAHGDPDRTIAVTVQPMVGPASAELSLCIKKDSRFGPVLTFGWGGAATDIAADQVVALPPINRLLARRMVEGTRIHRLLGGYQDHPPADLLLLEEILIRLGKLATDFAEIQSVQINPLLVVGTTFSAVSARVRVLEPRVPAPFHLVIAPYPNQYETNLAVNGLGTVLIRPIRPEDASLLQGLFVTLSPRSIYYRFFTPLKEIPDGMLARFTQIDYDREIAMVAILESDGEEQMLAVGRIIKGLDPGMAEFSILVGDRWHGKGIGAALLRWCLKIAKSQGVHHIWGTVLSDNTQMIALGRKLKFKIERQADSGEYEFKLDLAQLSDDM